MTQLANGQTEELDKLREVYDGEIRKVTTPVDKRYGRALVELQQELVAEDKLKEALVVKKEIEYLKAKLSGQPVPQEPGKVPMVAPSAAKDEKVTDAKGEELRWKGDFKKEKDGENTIYVLKADANQNVFMTTELDDPTKSYPNGLRWRFEYMSEDYTGIDFEVRFDFPALRTFVRTGSAIRPNGQWIERTLPFSDLKGEDLVNFQIHLTPGEGTVRFRNIELIAN